MNKLPLIHSISTVGVIKHYNQDYLIHDTRTDFTGPNGIGKSLLADLLQILFIAERKKIHFGTDSVKKEHRQIHTIPYKTPNAYFFLNIEVEHKMYITFGVNIPNSSASQIKLFRILNEPFDSEKDSKKTKKERQSLGSSLIPEQKLVYQDDFITKGTKPSIPSIDVLTKHLRDEKELYLDVFTRKAERNELYQFFFDKNILPLNLSQETHLTAFAKVLQAFSKANTLETDKDESLKSFLFENKKNAIEAEYKQNKQNLDDYVERYKNLSDLISSLTGKREYLEVLEELSITHQETEKEYLLNKFYVNKYTFNQQCKTWDDTKTKVDKLDAEIKKYKKSIPDLEVKNQMDDQNYSFEVLELVLLGPKIKHTENLAPALKKSNQNRTKVMQAITQAMLRIFKLTKTKYKDFEKIVEDLNDFFSERLISDKYNFKIDFTPNETFKIDWMKNLQSSTQAAYSEGELQFSDSVESFVEKIFTEATSYNEKIKFSDLLDPKTYFDLSTRLLDKDGVDQTGSTGQSYTAIVLLGIGRLSIVQKEDRKGVKFLILEEVSNMDKGNFNTFPNIAKEFGYQMLTMTPEPYGSNENEGWYLHHLIEGYEDVNINYAMPSSYFKTNESREDLSDYLKNINKQ